MRISDWSSDVCSSDLTGTVYEGLLDFDQSEIDVGSLPDTRTDVMVNIANPAAAFQWWRLPARGVGLARMEFIINALIKAHPMALIHPERPSAEDQRRIRELTRGPDTQSGSTSRRARGWSNE